MSGAALSLSLSLSLCLLTSTLFAAATLTQALLGVVHFAGFLGGLLALLHVVSARSAALAALTVQAGWVLLKLQARSHYEALFDPAQLAFSAVLAIHAAQTAAALLLLLLAPRAARTNPNANSRKKK